MSDIEKLRAATDRAKERHDDLLAKVRLGVHVEQSELGDANRTFTSAQAALIAAQEAASLAARGEEVRRMPQDEYERARAALTGGNFRRTL